MTELAALLVIADSASVVAITLVVVLILIVLGLSLSVWFYRKNLRLHRSLMFYRQNVKRCPSCNALMEQGANYCPNCGKEVQTVTTITS